jgi:hypothetical protein
MPDVAKVKKDAQEYASRCGVSSSLRIAHGACTMIAAVVAAYCAFVGHHEWDRRSSAFVVLLLAWELLAYGVQHWKNAQADEARYLDLAEQVERRPEDVVALEARLTAMGSPPGGGILGALAQYANGLRWGTNPKPIRAQLVGPSVALFAVLLLGGLASLLASFPTPPSH